MMNGRTSRRALNQVNRLLAMGNLKLETLTADRQEQARIIRAEHRGAFDEPIYVVPDAFKANKYREILDMLPAHHARLASFRNSTANDVGYTFENEYFTSPDAEVLYCIVFNGRPKRILEIGCGNSTKIIRQAIRDGRFMCSHRCIDPHPRVEIVSLADSVLRQDIESFDPAELISQLEPGDILFIDTSHKVVPANDVAYIYGRLLPLLRIGVCVHIHDVFLPYEYPSRWVRELGRTWGEQYLVQAMLIGGDNWEVLWPGYYLQKTVPEFSKYFSSLAGHAQSLWIRRRK
jgi:hypothetical protein